ncbi:hypothetical protein DITRI_Ditri16bG0107100 [Diplodiscus trichospermus]
MNSTICFWPDNWLGIYLNDFYSASFRLPAHAVVGDVMERKSWCLPTSLLNALPDIVANIIGIKIPYAGICKMLKFHLEVPEYKMTLPVEPRFNVPWNHTVSASVLVERKDSNKVACIINKSLFDYINRIASMATAFDCLDFSPSYPFIWESGHGSLCFLLKIEIMVSLMFLALKWTFVILPIPRKRSAIGQLGLAGISGVLRDYMSNVKILFSKPIEIADCNLAELFAVREALNLFFVSQWAQTHMVIIESDSVNVVKWVSNPQSVP